MMSWTSLSESGMLRLLWIILGLTGWLSVGVNGLKCYICQIDMEGCRLDVTPKASVYLQECAPSAIACATFYGERRYTGELWFQRLCFYPPDPASFRFDANNLPNSTEGHVHPYWHWFFFRVEQANKARNSASLPLIALPHPTLGFDNHTDFFIKTQTCNNSDGCNDWQGFYKWKYADGYPADMRSSFAKLKGMACYECRVTDPYHWRAYTCLKEDPDRYYSSYGDEIWFNKAIVLDQAGYGCTTIAIYQTSEYGLEPYFERNVWVPGDYWCLLRKYKSSPDQDNYIQYSRQGEAEGGEENKGSCRAGYLRSLEQEEAEAKYSWIGHRVFQTVDEFSDFLKCKEEVRKKYWWSYRRNPVIIPFNETAARQKIEENYWEAWREPFAYVGFRFCGPEPYCNTWSAEKLYNIMDKPPTTTTTSTTTTTWRTTTTTTPSTTTPTTTEKTTPTESGDEDDETVYPGEIPDDGCKIEHKNKAGRSEITFFLLFPFVNALLF